MHKDTYNIICKDFLIVLFSVKLKGLECISVGTLVYYYDIMQYYTLIDTYISILPHSGSIIIIIQ